MTASAVGFLVPPLPEAISQLMNFDGHDVDPEAPDEIFPSQVDCFNFSWVSNAQVSKDKEIIILSVEGKQIPLLSVLKKMAGFMKMGIVRKWVLQASPKNKEEIERVLFSGLNMVSGLEYLDELHNKEVSADDDQQLSFSVVQVFYNLNIISSKLEKKQCDLNAKKWFFQSEVSFIDGTEQIKSLLKCASSFMRVAGLEALASATASAAGREDEWLLLEKKSETEIVVTDKVVVVDTTPSKWDAEWGMTTRAGSGAPSAQSPSLVSGLCFSDPVIEL